MARVFYLGREITEEQAKALEAEGKANFGSFVSKLDDPDGPKIIMESGPSNVWLEKQPPEVFLQHVFGHTCTWKEMAQKWADEDEYGMLVVAELLKQLNYWLLQVPKERKERAALVEKLTEGLVSK